MLIFWLAVVHAEDDADATIVVEDTSPTTTPASTTFNVDDLFSSTTTLAEALQQQSGVYIRQLGGLGTTATISIRGTANRQNLLMLNGIPLNPDGVSTINIQDLPLQMLEKIALYRSHTPLQLMSSVMGGVISMSTTKKGKSSLHLGVDTWLNRWLRASTPLQSKTGVGNFFFSGLQAANSFPYYDNRNTPFNSTDDEWLTRVNNDVTQANFLGTWSTEKLNLLHTTIARDQGIPGHIITPSPDVRLFTRRHLSGFHTAINRSAVFHDFQGWHSYQQEFLDDSQGNIGRGDLRVDWRFQMYGIKGFHQLRKHHSWFPSLAWTVRQEDANERIEDDKHQRTIAQGQLGQEIIYDRWEWSTGLHTHWLSSSKNSLILAPKTSFLWRFSTTDHSWFSVTRGFRPPDFTEIYGNRGAIIGNPDLQPETGLTIDTGWVHQSSKNWLEYLQMSFFARYSQNEIIFVQNAQKISIPMNFTATRVFGLEGDWSVKINTKWLWNGTISWTNSENRSNIASFYQKELPNVPTWMSSQQIWWQGNYFSLGNELYWIDGNYWDAANQNQAPRRLIHNTTLRLTWKSWQSEITGRNIWNKIVAEVPVDPLNPDLGKHPEAIQDFLGYPLIGRTFVFSITWIPATGKK